MVQVLPSFPTFGDRVAQVLGQAGTDIGQGFLKGQSNQRDQQILTDIGSGQLTPMQTISRIAGLSPQTAQTIAPFAAQFLKPQKLSPGETKKQQLAAQAEADTAKEQQGKAQQKQRYEDILDALEEDLPYTGSPLIPGKSFLGESPRFLGMDVVLNPTAVEKRNQFDTTAIALEGLFRDLTTKGQLPQKTFQILLSRLPNSHLTEAENRGRIAAVREVLGKDRPKINESEFDSIAKKQTAKFQKESKKPKFDISNLEHKKRRDQILQEAGNDRTKAQELLAIEFE